MIIIKLFTSDYKYLQQTKFSLKLLMKEKEFLSIAILISLCQASFGSGVQ